MKLKLNLNLFYHFAAVKTGFAIYFIHSFKSLFVSKVCAPIQDHGYCIINTIQSITCNKPTDFYGTAFIQFSMS